MNLSSFAHDLRLRYEDEIVEVMRDLIRIPTRNTPPTGEEKAGQVYLAEYLQSAGLPVDLYQPDQVPGLLEHEAYWPGRNYEDRPNLSSVVPGRGGGRSLLLTGHMDTVALGDNVWSRPPFGAEIHDGKLYGLGSVDMKGPMGAMAVLYRALREQGLSLKGTLSFECVVDEEEGGVNATIAGRLRDGAMDAAILPEVTDLQIYPAARGALIASFIFTSSKGTWLEAGTAGAQSADAVEQMTLFLSHLDEFQAVRRNHPDHPLYLSYPDPVPVQITKVYAGGWGPNVPIAVPNEGRIELIAQVLPGERREDVLGELKRWLQSVIDRYPDAFATIPEMRFRLRWMVPTAMDPNHPSVQLLAESAAQMTGARPDILGAPYACDMFALHQIFDMPGIIFGPSGANAHAADEYVELESVFSFWESLLVFVLQWCGADLS
ncbi:MAG: M20/M25/M40 family metallo-hydrolase [Chloroflexota bacterium]|nr:M20/M25/M40 family metallo-hydrolase [Chloroflexota bacterium]